MVFCSGIFIEMMFQRFLQATGRTFLSMVSLVTGAATNIILDPILIFGYFGCPALGINYVWYAFWPAEIIAVIFMVIASRRLYQKVAK